MELRNCHKTQKQQKIPCRRIEVQKHSLFAKIALATLLMVMLLSCTTYASLNTAITIGSSGMIWASPLSQIQVIGNQTFTASGTPIILKGMGYTYFVNAEGATEGTWTMPSGGTIYGTWSTEGIHSNLDFYVASGANVVRVFMTAEFWMQNTNNFRDHIKYFVTEAADRGIYTVLTFWNTEDGMEMPQSTLPWEDGNTFITTSGDFVELWGDVSTTMKDYPSVIFELWNEPQGNETVWFNVAQQCINNIRSVGATQPIMIQWSYQINYDFGSGWHYGMEWVFNNPLNDSQNNLIYSSHIYSYTWAGFYNSDTGTEVTDYASIDYALEQCRVYEVAESYPVFIGEIGCNNWALETQLVYYNNTLTLLDQHGIGYAAFAAPPWHSGMQWGFVVFGAPNYELTSAGAILVDHLGGTSYADWISLQS